MSLEELFCAVDDFCRLFLPAWHRQMLANGARKRQRASRLTLGEIMTILIYFHQSQYRHFKAFYLLHLSRHCRGDFPNLLSYSRFVALIPTALIPMCIDLHTRRGADTGIAFIDATSLVVCHNCRIHSYKVFKKVARRGKTSMGWFHGFKLHLVVDDRGELLAFRITPGNVDDRQPVPELPQDLTGNLVGDRGYISQQLFKVLWDRGMAVAPYFSTHPGVSMTSRIQGGQAVTVMLASARPQVGAHRQKRFVVALKSAGEEKYRYLMASEMSWRAANVASAHPLRWLVEVFFEDWKSHEGWGQLAPQWDEEGSSRGLTLSLPLDHALRLHPQQRARIANHLPACTVGSLQPHARIEALIAVIRGIVDAEDPHQPLDEIMMVAKRLFPLRDSANHMNGRDLGRLEPTPSLKYRAAACMA